MRFDGELGNEEEKENERAPQPKLMVGYALTSKKAKSFLQPKLEGLARIDNVSVSCAHHHLSYLLKLSTCYHFDNSLYELMPSSWARKLRTIKGLPINRMAHLALMWRKKGIMFVSIDQNRPLLDQGPFDIVLHKLTGKEWRQILEDYRKKNPEVTVLDPPDAIQHLRNRQSMLQDVADINLSDSYGKIGVPKQLVVTNDPSSIADKVTKAGLTLPLVAKPLVVDGTAKSHELSLAYDPFSLSKLDPPLVLQEFVNHGGVLFKVYIVGETIKVVRRFSLPDVNKHDLPNNAGVFRFPRVSCAAASADDADLDPCIAEHPPGPLLERLARELRRRLGLCLFNIDIIREHGTRDRYYVIDINYFPGYGKMPGYEQVFTDFLLSFVQSKYKRRLTNT